MPRRLAPLIALSAALILLVIAWSMAVPLGSAQDEPDHYVKALGAGGGELLGRSPEEFLAPLTDALKARSQTRSRSQPSLSQLAARQTQAQRRSGQALDFAFSSGRDFLIPTKLVPNFTCGQGNSDSRLPLRCGPAVPFAHRSSHGTTRVGSHFGTYPPLIYVVTGVLMRLASNPTTAYRIGRFANAVLALLLVGFAVAAVWRSGLGVLSLIGVMLAVTPAALYMFSVLNPSGAEMASGLCFAACLLRLLGPPLPVPRRVWIGCGLGAAVLALSRPLGPVFVVYTSLVTTCLVGRSQTVRAWRANRRAMLVLGTVIVVALGLALAWAPYESSYPLTLGGLGDELGAAIRDVPSLLGQSIGFFVADFTLPAYVWAPWALMIIGLLAVSAALANRNERIKLVALCAITLIALVGFADLHSQTGGVVYGRYVFPFLVPVPLYATSILVSRHEHLPLAVRLRFTQVIVVIVAAVQAAAWWVTARRIAVGTNGPLYFPPKSIWHPPGGWSPWILFVLIGTLMYMFVAAWPSIQSKRSSDVVSDGLVPRY
jgi:hypothetical protein